MSLPAPDGCYEPAPGAGFGPGCPSYPPALAAPTPTGFPNPDSGRVGTAPLPQPILRPKHFRFGVLALLQELSRPVRYPSKENLIPAHSHDLVFHVISLLRPVLNIRAAAIQRQRRSFRLALAASPSYSPNSPIMDRPSGHTHLFQRRRRLAGRFDRERCARAGGCRSGLQGLHAPPVTARISAIRTLRG